MENDAMLLTRPKEFCLIGFWFDEGTEEEEEEYRGEKGR